jgi:hypothetical protein
MKIVECHELAEGKTVMMGDIIFVGTKNPDGYKNNELEVTEIKKVAV